MVTIKMMTIETTRRVVDYFGIGFTESYVTRAVQSRALESVSKPYSGIRDSKYGYGVSKQSVVNYLLDKGISQDEINEVL